MQTTPTQSKPAYLGLLNAISLAESNAGVYLRAWADVTDDEDLAATLRLVAARESSHGEVFCRRLCELGYELRRKPDPKGAELLAKYANPNISDCEKVGDERGVACPARRDGERSTRQGGDEHVAGLISRAHGRGRRRRGNRRQPVFPPRSSGEKAPTRF